MKALRLAVLGLAPLLAQAAIIGEVKIGGESEVTLTTIDWAPFIAGDPYNGTGSVSVLGTATGIFAPLVFNNVGTIVDRDAVAPSTVPLQPAGGINSISVPNWLTFVALPGISLELTSIFPGNFTAVQCAPPAANEDTCTPPPILGEVSPYNLSNFIHPTAGLSSNANFSVRGNVRNAGNTIIGTFDGVFGAEFLGKPLEQVLAEVTGAPGFVVASYSATIVANDVVIPEPSTGMLAIGALLLLVPRAARRLRQ
jgi:hypothetical protein